jgi:hypothetical protein
LIKPIELRLLSSEKLKPFERTTPSFQFLSKMNSKQESSVNSQKSTSRNPENEIQIELIPVPLDGFDSPHK